MPFETVEGAPLDGVPLLYRMGREFQVTRPFAYRDPRDGTVTRVPAHDTSRPPVEGNSTDFASVPPFLWGLIANYGPQTLPAILHDAMVEQARRAPEAERLPRRRVADDLFRIALIDNGIHLLRARVMWAAVSLESRWRHGGTAGRVLIAQVALGALALIAATVLGVLLSPWWMLGLALPAALAPLQRGSAPLVVAATYLGALYAPLVLGAFLAAHVEGLIALVVWLATGRRGPRPQAEPTIVWKDEYASEGVSRW
ncbi:DUF1353 domain-containing protein [Microcella daejeonensis]|uniref:DUF1353 domain-containing protein n=1 Tax=Microcella daejeonensis TaxID=2994971 RepID=UPI00226F06BA|nr:DUF1353 domain-containing protein [Microcella daejeonensis]WAB83964.1 DUF1353 domain-containing protein [Microcella daejeonensis]